MILDKPYDIATFLREPMGTERHRLMEMEEMPRKKMLRRYRALLDHLAARGYDRVVFAAHSQGTVLTVTLHEAPPPAARPRLADDVRLPLASAVFRTVPVAVRLGRRSLPVSASSCRPSADAG